jgi:hypothetical protein
MYFFKILRLQWQAQDVPQPPELADEEPASLPEEGADGSVLVAAGAAAAAPVPEAAVEPPRKSVAYQPEPLS